MELYLAGDAGGLVWLTPAGVRIGALDQRHELVDVVSLALAVPPSGQVREVLVTVRAKDAAGATLAMRYQLELVREDRWLVAAVNTTEKAG